MVHLDSSSRPPRPPFYAVRTLLFLLPRRYFFCRDSCGPPHFTHCLRAVLVRPLLSSSYIYFLLFDCEVKLIFHVIKSHSYKFVHVWLTPSIPPPGGLWSQKLGQTAVTNKETRLLIQEKRSPCLTVHSTNLSLLWRSLPILLMVKLHHLSQIDFQQNICRT